MSSTAPCFASRPVGALPLVEGAGWSLKPYRILGRDSALLTPLDDEALRAAFGVLPKAGEGPERPPVGFVIEHLATPLDYLVICWWESRNELVARILVRRTGASWGPPPGNESFCVWDLDIMWFERNAFIRTMLAISTPDPLAYLAARFEKSAVG